MKKSPNHRITESPNHRITESPNHRITESPNHRITESPFKVFLILAIVLLNHSFISAQKHIPNQLMNDVISGPSTAKADCDSPGIGCPYDGAPIKYVKVNFHFYLDPDGTGNFNEISDGSVITAPIPYNGYQRAEDLVKEANKQLEVNGPQIFGPNPTKSPVCKIPMQLVLGGVFFHRIPKKGVCYLEIPPIWQAKVVNPNSEININMTSHTSKCPYVAGLAEIGRAHV